jgi:hypothetical protein
LARRSVLPLLLVLVLSSSARAQEKDWKWDPAKKPTAVAGARHTSEAEDVEKSGFVRTLAKTGDTVEKQANEVVVAHRYVREVLEAENGVPKKQRITFEKWKRTTNNGPADTSLEGKSLILKGADPASWEPEDPKAALSPDARRWFNDEVAHRKGIFEDEKGKSILPEKPVAPGAEWTRDPVAVARALFGEGVEVEAAKSSVKGKVADVKVQDGVHIGRVEVKVVLALKPNARVSDVRVDVSITLEGSLEPHKRDALRTTTSFTTTAKSKEDGPRGETLVKLETSKTLKLSEGPVEDAGGKK